MSFVPISIGDLQIQVPIIQGGMGIGISLSGLAGAVAQCGAVGVISAAVIGMNEKDISINPIAANNRALRREIQQARTLAPHGVIGTNIMVAMTHYAELVSTALEEGIDMIISGAGLPLELPKLYRDVCEKTQKLLKTKLIPIVSSARAASIIAKKWFSKTGLFPDAVVLEGPKAGGHLGFTYDDVWASDKSLEALLPEVIDVVKGLEDKAGREIPVFAAGGIFTGKDIYDIMELGAKGVQMGTRFVATHECDADERFKQRYIDVTEEEIRLIKSPVGLPGRVIHNQFVEDMYEGKKRPKKCIYDCVLTCDPATTPYCISSALINAQKGNLHNGFAFAGSNAHRITEIISVKELIDSLTKEYDEVAKIAQG